MCGSFTLTILMASFQNDLTPISNTHSHLHIWMYICVWIKVCVPFCLMCVLPPYPFVSVVGVPRVSQAWWHRLMAVMAFHSILFPRHTLTATQIKRIARFKVINELMHKYGADRENYKRNVQYWFKNIEDFSMLLKSTDLKIYNHLEKYSIPKPLSCLHSKTTFSI